MLALGLVLASCGGANPAVRDASGQVVEGGEVDAFDLRVGDCFINQNAGQFNSVPVVPCAELHFYELFHSFDVPGVEYPGADEVSAIASDTCADQFENFIGFSYGDSVWDVTAVTPTEDTWDDEGGREAICAVYPLNGIETTGTARGIAE